MAPRGSTSVWALLLLLALCAATPIASSRSVQPKPVVQATTQELDHTDYSMDIFVDGYAYCSTTCNRPDTKTCKPVKGAIVGVTCVNLYGLKTDFATAYTDAKGYFLVELQEYDVAEFGVANCKATLLLAPGSDCRTVTGVNKGISGAPLGKSKVVGRKRIYTVGPFFTVPNKCASSLPR